MFTTMIFREEISISWAFWSGKNHFCLLRPVQNSFPISPENYFRNVCLLFANKSALPIPETIFQVPPSTTSPKIISSQS